MAKKRKVAKKIGKKAVSRKNKTFIKKKPRKTVSSEKVVAGRREKFHKLDCQWAAYLKGAAVRREFENWMEARANGLIPCRDCFGYTV